MHLPQVAFKHCLGGIYQAQPFCTLILTQAHKQVHACLEDPLPPKHCGAVPHPALSQQDRWKRHAHRQSTVQMRVSISLAHDRQQCSHGTNLLCWLSAGDSTLNPSEKTGLPLDAGPVRVVHVQRRPDIEAVRNGLPITGLEQEVMEALLLNDVVVLCGETGCGKTTQVCFE